ncbi:MAG TPA: hypothetical protein VIL58_05895 [Thermoplasmata archaeon]
MELEIMQRRENPLLKRVEVRFRVSHPNASSPRREELRQELAKELHAAKDIVILDFLRSDFGRSTSRGYAKVYKAKEDALRIERKHILVRNGLLAAEVKAEKAPAPKPAPRAREVAPKPAEKAPPKAEKAEKPEKEAKPGAEKKEEKPAAKAEKKAEPKKPAKEAK